MVNTDSDVVIGGEFTKKVVVLLMFAFSVAIVVLGVSPAFAVRPPTSPGQPNQDCESLPPQYEPHGFTTDGFANAATHYAGSGVNVEHANSDKAVSQYDVACFQQYSNDNVHLQH